MGLREGCGRGDIQLALWTVLSGLCNYAYEELHIQEKSRFKHYLSLPIFPSLPNCPCGLEDLRFILLDSLATRVD